MQFCRAVGNKKKFPMELAPHMKRDSTDLFKIWMESDKDFLKVMVRITRGTQKSSESEEKFSFRKLKDINLSVKKREDLLQRKKKLGHWCYDTDFPGDMEEVLVLMGEKSFSMKNTSFEKMEGIADLENIDRESGEHFFGEGGVLGAGVVPAVPGLDEAGQISFFETVSQGQQGQLKRAKLPTVPKAPGDEPTEVRPPHITNPPIPLGSSGHVRVVVPPLPPPQLAQ
jgi:hypothetical protein